MTGSMCPHCTAYSVGTARKSAPCPPYSLRNMIRTSETLYQAMEAVITLLRK